MTVDIAWPLAIRDRNSPLTGVESNTPTATSFEWIRRARDAYRYERLRLLPSYGYHDEASLKATLLAGGVTATLSNTLRGSSTDLFPASGYVKIEDEIIAYAGKTTGTDDDGTLTGLTRGQLGTADVEHASGETVELYFPAFAGAGTIPAASVGGYHPPAAWTLDNFPHGTVGGNNGIRLVQLNHELFEFSHQFAGTQVNEEVVVKTPYTAADGYPIGSLEITEDSSVAKNSAALFYFFLSGPTTTLNLLIHADRTYIADTVTVAGKIILWKAPA